MKKHEIKVGGHYIAKVSGKLTTVKVEAIRKTNSYRAHQPHTPVTRYDVTNLTTGRRTTFRSAAKFRRFAKKDGSGPAPSRLETGYYSDAQEQQILEAAGKVDVDIPEPLTDSMHPDGF